MMMIVYEYEVLKVMLLLLLLLLLVLFKRCYLLFVYKVFINKVFIIVVFIIIILVFMWGVDDFFGWDNWFMWRKKRSVSYVYL